MLPLHQHHDLHAPFDNALCAARPHHSMNPDTSDDWSIKFTGAVNFLVNMISKVLNSTPGLQYTGRVTVEERSANPFRNPLFGPQWQGFPSE
jgi:hypothetical protein